MFYLILTLVLFAIIIIGERIAMKKKDTMFEELYNEVDSITTKL